MATFVFDNGPLTHIAQGRALDALEKIAGSNKCVYPLVVASELGINRPLTAKTRIGTTPIRQCLNHNSSTP